MRQVALVLLTACSLGPPDVGDPVPGFELEDVNPASASFGERIGPSTFSGERQVWYFGHSNCGYCSTQFGLLDQMVAELDAEGGAPPVAGINAAGLEEHNDLIMEGRVLPWLQDPFDDVWSSWGAEWRDIFVVDGSGIVVDKRSLTSFDLQDDDNYAAYKALLAE
jgi:hypothetical protein